jgi:hypothetical protein
VESAVYNVFGEILVQVLLLMKNAVVDYDVDLRTNSRKDKGKITHD